MWLYHYLGETPTEEEISDAHTQRQVAEERKAAYTSSFRPHTLVLQAAYTRNFRPRTLVASGLIH